MPTATPPQGPKRQASRRIRKPSRPTGAERSQEDSTPSNGLHSGTRENPPRQAAPPHNKQDGARRRAAKQSTRRLNTINETINGGCPTGLTRMTTAPEGKQVETATSNDDRRRDGATTTTPDDDQPMTAPDDNEGRSKQQGRARHARPIERPTASNGNDRNHVAGLCHRHGGNEQDPREKHRPRHIHGPATASNRQQRPRRTQTETQTAIAPPHLSNNRGAERYDDRTERIASRPAGGTGRKPARETRNKQGKARRDRTRSHEQRDDDDAPPDMSKERGERRDENEPRRAIQFVLITHRPSRPSSRAIPIHHPHSAVFTSSPQTADERRGHHSYEMRKPDKRVGK